MAMEVFLYNSTVCRLCGEENDNGTFLYSAEENSQNISELVNAYLPIKVFDDGQLPRTICPGCTIQLEATVEFITLIVNGQRIIRALHQREVEYKKTVLNASDADPLLTDNVVQEVDIENGAYQPDHLISLKVAGLSKPKRKRGRPAKKPKSAEDLALEAAARETEVIAAAQEEEPSGKRKRKAPSRFQEVVQGKELEKIFIESGVTDGEDSEPDVKPDITAIQPKLPEIIGHTDSGELVVVVKGKGRGRPKGRLRPTREKCAICGKEFTCSGRYMSHVAAHGPVSYRCEECSDTFPTRLEFNAHQETTQHKGQIVIPCSKGGESEEPLIVKAESPAKEQVTTTELPDLDPTPEEGDKDLQMKAEDGNSDDKDSSVTKADADNVEESAPKTKLKCGHCDKKFSSKQSRSMHIRAVHRGERPYSCAECGASFAYPHALSLHALRHRARAAKGYGCDLCGKVLNHPSSVAYHKEAEHAGHKFVCNKCGKSFKHKQLLTRHQLVHSHQRPFHCKVCNAAFKTKPNLLNHQLLHSGVKKHACDLCKQRFAHKTSLTLHMRWHNGQKPYVCGECGKAFSQKGNLSEHERIHTGEKPFTCALCPRQFTTSSQHRLHLRRHAMTQGRGTTETENGAKVGTAVTAAAPITVTETRSKGTGLRVIAPKPQGMGAQTIAAGAQAIGAGAQMVGAQTTAMPAQVTVLGPQVTLLNSQCKGLGVHGIGTALLGTRVGVQGIGAGQVTMLGLNPESSQNTLHLNGGTMGGASPAQHIGSVVGAGLQAGSACATSMGSTSAGSVGSMSAGSVGSMGAGSVPRRRRRAAGYRCRLCARHCASPAALAQHMQRHARHKCPHCPRAFLHTDLLSKHVQLAHGAVSPVRAASPAERVIYVTIDDEPYTVLTREECSDQSGGEVYSQAAKPAPSPPAPVPAPRGQQDHIAVTDEQGNPLHFTMQDGTQLAITSLDGHTLQVITEDGQTIPVEINNLADDDPQVPERETTVHHLNLPKSEDESSAVTHYYTIV